ncbi:MAG TPA: short chain dehydrogenase [Thermoanaerobaculia bacterium]|nr:short chain dehydrogenase [Thermoanaerobaculia bacterium]
MRVLVVGATGTIGSAIVKALSAHEVIEAAYSHGIRVDISDIESIRQMYQAAGTIDAVISAAGSTRRKPLRELTDEDFAYSIAHKLMGQVNLVRYGLGYLADGGSFTLTSGILGREPILGGEAISMVNLGLEGFARAAAMELPRGIRVNVVSPPWVEETLRELQMEGFRGLPAATVAQAYVRALTSSMTGEVLEP